MITSRTDRVRTLVALGVVAAAYFLQDAALTAPYHALRAWLGILPSPVPNTLLCSSYSLLMVFRLIWWLAVIGLVTLIVRSGIGELLRPDKVRTIDLLKGLVLGLAVMGATILAIVAVGAAKVHLSEGSTAVHAKYGVAWLLAEILGSAGEELLYRTLILVLSARLFGVRTAIMISALAFSLAHGANPGASVIWMVRLAAAGLLLAYSVIRSGSIWWAIGYHAGWNLASAPLFGAAGSGYIDQGHIFTFTPIGSPWITGGDVGPEGSAFAFLAVVCATLCLLWTVPRRQAR